MPAGDWRVLACRNRDCVAGLMHKHKRWLPDVKQVRARSFNSMAGNTTSRKITLHDEGNAPGIGDAVELMRYVVDKGIEYHCTWNVRNGLWCQSTPFHMASKALENGGLDGGIGANRSGTINIQICVAGFNGRDGQRFTDVPLNGAWRLADIADAWGIPLEPLGDFQCPVRSARLWKRDGVSGHLMAPRNSHGDPGRIDFDKLVRAARAQQKRRRK